MFAVILILNAAHQINHKQSIAIGGRRFVSIL